MFSRLVLLGVSGGIHTFAHDFLCTSYMQMYLKPSYLEHEPMIAVAALVRTNGIQENRGEDSRISSS